ncbi:CPBP family intramembrane metalloprotease [Halorarum halophilum]|uniref:CPBP family intramembrane metalloprotease n=1 Tax=Halorarum halophilum TaxID=2743090 RepID=A0A7D5GBD5_9EURY|nr:CPBP family glutamic-type intramembrane protease [Halobaculum halophilum]QLG27426.1 CPBP family intramembrane metalloprotease [Halobaculum halophilum]
MGPGITNGIHAGAAPLTFIADWITAGEVVPLIGLWILLSSVDVGIQYALESAVHREFLVAPPFSYRHKRWLRVVAPNQHLRGILPAYEPQDSIGYTVTDSSWIGLGQRSLVVTVGVLFEEVLARGLPLALTQYVGLPVMWCIAVGTVYWAFLHRTGRGLSLVVTTGWLLAWLTVAGHWPLAVGLHLGNNLVVLLYTHVTSHR